MKIQFNKKNLQEFDNLVDTCCVVLKKSKLIGILFLILFLIFAFVAVHKPTTKIIAACFVCLYVWYGTLNWAKGLAYLMLISFFLFMLLLTINHSLISYNFFVVNNLNFTEITLESMLPIIYSSRFVGVGIIIIGFMGYKFISVKKNSLSQS